MFQILVFIFAKSITFTTYSFKNIESRCPGDTIFHDCATSCPSVCGEDEPELCTMDCNKDPCVCPPGTKLLKRGSYTCIEICPDKGKAYNK